MVIEIPDIEPLLIRRVYDALVGKYPSLYSSRTAPADVQGRRVVVLHQEGGLPMNPLLTQPRVAVDVYAPTELEAQRLALDVQAVLNATQGHPFRKVTATGPSPILDGGKGPQRRLYADTLVRNGGS